MACDDRQNVRKIAAYNDFNSMRTLTSGGKSAHSRPSARETGPSGRMEGSAIAPSINVKGIVVDMSGHPLGQMRGHAGRNATPGRTRVPALMENDRIEKASEWPE
jgi:hypothetical protein